MRVGVAMSDPLGMTAQPLEVIDRRRQDAARRIAELVGEYMVEQVVVGLPLALDGSEGSAAQAVRQFMVTLAAMLTVPIATWDERFSTVQAERAMIEGGARRETRRRSIDKVAAALILQSYLDARGTLP